MPPKHDPKVAREKAWDCCAFNPKLERRQSDGMPLIYLAHAWWPDPELRSEKKLGWKELPLCRSCWCIVGTGHAPLCQAVYPRYTGQGRSTASKNEEEKGHEYILHEKPPSGAASNDSSTAVIVPAQQCHEYKMRQDCLYAWERRKGQQSHSCSLIREFRAAYEQDHERRKHEHEVCYQ